ncbi:hypothetical protein [Nocardioides solisilvae]|uniref:hypothetical protein n=1 Tax=Nocardioides solisilvae TaxID=1542435 RepID=UPI0013A59252|nr:hypothetical protein [Nocardioides solisilvae]
MVIEQLDPLFTEIAGYLGEIEGNERVWSILDSEETRPLQEGWTREPGYFTVPGTYGFDTQALYVAVAPAYVQDDPSGVTNAEREQLLQQLITDVWNESRDAWSTGTIETVYRSASRNVWEPAPSRMAAAANDLGDVARWLADQVAPGSGWTSPQNGEAHQWLVDLHQNWPATSQSSQSFYEFWDDVSDKCSLYLHAATRLAATSAQATAVVNDLQTNLVEAATAVRDRAVETLKQWQAWKDSSGAWPTGRTVPGDAPGILGGLSLATGAIGLFPPAAFLGFVSVAAGVGSYLVPAGEKLEMAVMEAVTASDLYNGFLTDLKTMSDELTKALDSLRTEAPGGDATFGHQSLQAFTADVVANRHDWSPLPVNL